MSVFLQSVLHLSAFRTGLTLLPSTFGLLVTSILAPKLAMKFNHKIIMIIGFILAIGSTFLLKYQFGLNTHFMDIAPGLTVFGLGLGFVISLRRRYFHLIPLLKKNKAQHQDLLQQAKH